MLMASFNEKDYVLVVQCHIVKERCPGYNCERAFHERTGGFADYPKDRELRLLTFTCGGCCGLATHRKLGNFLKSVEKREGIGKERIAVHLSSCVTKNNYHGPPCPHLDYLKALIASFDVDLLEDTFVWERSEERRREGLYGD